MKEMYSYIKFHHDKENYMLNTFNLYKNKS